MTQQPHFAFWQKKKNIRKRNRFARTQMKCYAQNSIGGRGGGSQSWVAPLKVEDSLVSYITVQCHHNQAKVCRENGKFAIISKLLF